MSGVRVLLERKKKREAGFTSKSFRYAFKQCARQEKKNGGEYLMLCKYV